MLYALLTGRPPFRSASVHETLRQVLEDEPVPPRRRNPAVPRDLDTVCLKCLEKEPVRCYATAADLAEDLLAYLEGRPIPTRPAGTLERAAKWVRRRPLLAVSYGLLLLAATLAAGGGSPSGSGGRRKAHGGEADRAREDAVKAAEEAEAARERAGGRGGERGAGPVGR